MYRRRDRSSIERRGLSPLLISLGIQLFRQLDRLPEKPPVTILFLAANILPHVFHVNFFQYSLSDVEQNCIHPRIIVNSLLGKHHHVPVNRLILAGFMHADDVHLYYNMLSLCWKGINLERTLGSSEFLQLIIFSLVTSHTLLVTIAYFLDALGVGGQFSGYHSCAIGFSAVLFSLKYVWNYLSDDATNIMGLFVIPAKYAAWAELVLVSLLTPNVSFIGHLSGILAGVLYVHVFKKIMVFLSRSSSTRYDGSDHIGSNGPRYTYASGTATGGASSSYSSSSNAGTDRSNVDHEAIRRSRLNRMNPQAQTTFFTSASR